MLERIRAVVNDGVLSTQRNTLDLLSGLTLLRPATRPRASVCPQPLFHWFNASFHAVVHGSRVPAPVSKQHV